MIVKLLVFLFLRSTLCSELDDDNAEVELRSLGQSRWTLISKAPSIPLSEVQGHKKVQYYQNEPQQVGNRRKIYYITSDSYANYDDKKTHKKKPILNKRPAEVNNLLDNRNLTKRPQLYEDDAQVQHSEYVEDEKKPSQWPDLGHFYDEVPNKSKFFEDLGCEYIYYDFV
jgi:hypothetical protein